MMLAQRTFLNVLDTTAAACSTYLVLLEGAQQERSRNVLRLVKYSALAASVAMHVL